MSVSTTLLVLVLTQNAAASAVPQDLATATVKASLLFAAGKTPTALSAQVLSLAGSGLSAGALKLKLIGFAALLVVGLAFGWLVAPLTPQSDASAVQESAAAAEGMRQQAQALVRAVSAFRLR